VLKKKIIEIKNIIGQKNFGLICILFFLLIISSITEFIGLGSIPIYIGLITDPNIYLDKLNYDLLNNFLTGFTNSEIMIFASILLIIIFVLKNIFQIFLIYLQGQIIMKIKKDISSKIFSNFLNLEFKEILKRNSSVFIRTINLDAGNTTIFILNILNLVKEFLVIIVIISLLLIADPLISIILFIFFSLALLIFYIITQKKLFLRGKKIQLLHSEIIKIINETVGSIKEIRIFNLQNKISKIFDKTIEKNELYLFKNYVVRSIPRVYLETICVFAVVLVILSFIYANKNILEILPLMSLIVISALRLIPGLNQIQNSISTLKSIYVSYEHIRNELEFYREKIKKKEQQQNMLKFKKDIKLKQISFKFDRKDDYVFQNLDLIINKGDKIGIVGESGAGKTTLINLILGLIEPTKGKVKVDGFVFDIKKYSWTNLAYVPQEIFLLDDTIEKNILFGLEKNQIAQIKIEEATTKAQIIDFIKKLPEGFDTKVGERGVNLSIGQKQRIGIARALCRDPDFIIFDESSSSLDQFTESNFVNDVFKATQDKTIIFISHRIDALKNCNKIFDLNKKKFLV